MLDHLDNHARLMFIRWQLEHRLVQIVIKFLTNGIDPLDPMLFDHRLDFRPAKLDPLDQALQRLIGCAFSRITFAGGLDCARQIIDRAYEVACKAGVAIFPGRLHLPLGAAAHIFRFGQGAQS